MEDDITYTHARIKAEEDIVAAVMAFYEHTKEHPSCRMVPMLVPPVQRLEALENERRAALARDEERRAVHRALVEEEGER